MIDFNKVKEGVVRGIMVQMEKTGEDIAQSMRDKLIAGDHIDTGELVSSIHVDTEQDGGEINTYISIDAKNNGTWYAEFIEFGTGIHNENGGRQTPWKYKDRNGEWHTTQGMEADPFIRPSVAEHIGEFEDGIKTAMDLKRYGK